MTRRCDALKSAVAAAAEAKEKAILSDKGIRTAVEAAARAKRALEEEVG